MKVLEKYYNNLRINVVRKQILLIFVLTITNYNAYSENTSLKFSPARSCILPVGNSIVIGDSPSSSGLIYLQMKDKLFYVYVLINSIDNKIFYVGKGSGGRINVHEMYAKAGRHHNPHASNKILKILRSGGYIIKRKIHESHDEDYIFQKEIELIAEIGIKNLCNISLGGKGAPGMTHSKYYCKIISKRMGRRIVSDETKYKISMNHADVSGENNPMHKKGGHTQASRKKISETRKKMKIKFSAKTIAKMKEMRTGSKNANASLTENMVLEIRELFNKGRTRIELTKLFKITPNCLSKILTRRTWKHI